MEGRLQRNEEKLSELQSEMQQFKQAFGKGSCLVR
jgi:hypothetical protein